MKKYFFVLFFIYFSSCTKKPSVYNSEDLILDSVLKYNHYQLHYSTKHKQAEWVFYDLTRSELNGKYERQNDFREDPRIKNGATLLDYRGSGYDRGHLAPAADFAFDKRALSETFYLTNISPQDPNFNRKKWLELEKFVRYKTKQKGTMLIYVGPILTDNLKTIGNKVSVPRAYFKAIVNLRDKKGIAFLMENKTLYGPLFQYSITIDLLEELLSYDLYSELTGKDERLIEATVDLNYWKIQ